MGRRKNAKVLSACWIKWLKSAITYGSVPVVVICAIFKSMTVKSQTQ